MCKTRWAWLGVLAALVSANAMATVAGGPAVRGRHLPDHKPVPLQKQQAAQQRLHDAADGRSARLQMLPSSRAAALARSAPKLALALDRVHQINLAAARAFDAAARAAHRKHLGSIRPMTLRSLKDGSYERGLQQARSAFIADVGGARLKQMQAAEKKLQAERAAASDVKLRAHLDELLARYGRGEAELRKVLASRATAQSIPDILVPRSLAGEVKPASATAPIRRGAR